MEMPLQNRKQPREEVDMLYFMKPLPESKLDTTDWSPFIKNEWFRNHFMYFVYCLQAVLLLLSILLGIWRSLNDFMKVGLFISTYVIHELLHLVVIYQIGDISITHSGIFFWINSGAVLSKLRFFVFMFLPFIGLTVVPAIVALFLFANEFAGQISQAGLPDVSGGLKDIVAYVAWINAIIAGSDIINSVLIAIKPKKSLFYRGHYKVRSDIDERIS